MPTFEYENEVILCGYKNIAGVDEAGRGPLAGPVCAAAVILEPHSFIVEGINDSKKLSDKKRNMLYDLIIENAIAYAITFVDHEEIDTLNIRNAAFLAMRNAVEELKIQPDYVLVDGNAVKWIDKPHTCIVKGDMKSTSIAAASILAKVARDRLMCEMDSEYPGYGFAKHKGYPTVEHYKALTRLGPCPIHRRSFNLKI